MNRRQAKDCLKAVIAAWRSKNGHDQHAQDVCRRLLESEAPSAFAAILDHPERWGVLLGDCIWADRVQRYHQQVVSGSAADLAAAKEAATLTERLAEIILPNIVPVDGRPSLGEEAINVLRWEAYMRRQSALRCIHEHSRRSDPAAARSAAVGWIKESVQHLSGNANLEQVRVLAEATLGCAPGVLTIDTVRKAVGPRAAVRDGYRVAKKALAHTGAKKEPKEPPVSQT
jgi:hypothetical protein